MLFLRWWRICPVRHCLLLVCAAALLLFFLFRSNPGAMSWIFLHIARPWHRALAWISNAAAFSVAELCYVLVLGGILAYLIAQVVLLIRRPQRWRRLWRLAATVLLVPASIYGGYCFLWSSGYSAPGFAQTSGIETALVSAESLTSVTAYFAELANTYSGEVARDGEGHFAEEVSDILAQSDGLYDAVEAAFPSLSGANLRPKPMVFSRLMSYLGFTGFFFPFTGEANVNVDSPACLLPSTIAHEIAHQRGVVLEDEANFVAVLASLESGNSLYMYSASLLAYIHLGNALHSADYDTWLVVYQTLNQEVVLDLLDNNAYWAAFETPVADAAEAVYTGYMHSSGDSRGLQSYGACVDLLVAYYLEQAEAAIG